MGWPVGTGLAVPAAWVGGRGGRFGLRENGWGGGGSLSPFANHWWGPFGVKREGFGVTPEFTPHGGGPPRGASGQ